MKNKSWKTDWNLSLLYSSPKDARIEKDMLTIERVCKQFEKKYKGTRFTSNTKLFSALNDYKALSEHLASGTPLLYFHYKHELDASDAYVESQIQLLSERLTKAGNRITFFELELGKIPVSEQKKILKKKRYALFAYQLSRVFLTARYDLTEPEEKLLSLLSGPASAQWVQGVEKALSKRTVSFKEREVPLNEALSLVGHLHNQTERTFLWKAIIEALATVSEFAESEINALFTKKKLTDELRGFKQSYEATILGYENNAKSVLAMTQAVTESFPVSHKFYKIKKKLLALEKMSYADRAAPLPLKSEREYLFEDAASMVKSAFQKAHPRYSDILESYLKRGQIDVFPKKGKSGGAFCSSSYKNPTFVLLNHTNDFNSVLTLAHEMGHAIHSERTSATQSVLYEGYSTVVAETASTFFEGFAFNEIVRDLPPEERVKILHDRIQDDIATVFRQIACFNFEHELHTEIRKKGWVPKEEIASLLNKHMQSYLGPAIELNPEDGLFFVSWSHIRRPFYVYSYAYGQLISKVLLKRVAKDSAYIEKVDHFLSQGRSKTPEDIFKQIGLNLSSPALFKEALSSIKDDVDELERLIV